jgi:hypothetical protein
MARFRFPPNSGGLGRRNVLDELARPQSVRDSRGADAVLAVHYFVAQSHTPRNRCVRFVFGVAAASRNTRFQAAR